MFAAKSAAEPVKLRLFYDGDNVTVVVVVVVRPKIVLSVETNTLETRRTNARVQIFDVSRFNNKIR